MRPINAGTRREPLGEVLVAFATLPPGPGTKGSQDVCEELKSLMTGNVIVAQRVGGAALRLALGAAEIAESPGHPL